VNSLSQLLLKMTLPGVPDFYQGTELWDFNLVDPDNRRPVDFEARCALVEELHSVASTDFAHCAAQVGSMWPDPRVKLLVTMRCLALRNQWPDVFTRGDYLPLVASGPAADHIVAFARRTDDRCAISIAPRHVQDLRSDAADHAEGGPNFDWGETRIVLPAEMSRVRSWWCQLSGRAAEIHDSETEPAIKIAALLEVLPVALLTPDLRN
jgi:maltooligosyltrehalose synthase